MTDNHFLEQLENESIYIFREVASQFSRPALLFSGGKDSITLVHLAVKAFAPGQIPFPLVHIDTGHNFPEALEFRDYLVNKIKAKLIVCKVEDTIKRKSIPDATGKFPSRNVLQTYSLLETIEKYRFDACIGGARRDEEKARAKERIFSVRNSFGEWEPKRQRPQLWEIYNGKITHGENVRVFPISNWTEMDVWAYIQKENIELPSIYFSHERPCLVTPQGQLIAVSDYIQIDKRDKIETKTVRYRTVGDMTCTAAVPSTASTIKEIIADLEQSTISERGATRIDDLISDTAMEDRKKLGYF